MGGGIMYYTIQADHTGNKFVREFRGNVEDLRRIYEQIYKIPVKTIYRITEQQYRLFKKD
jgi:hypothetical protein